KTSDDVAQKRVAAALQNLSAFFQRRGFKTASVAAVAAVLERTATSSSALVATALTKAALQMAPPTLFGCAGLISRIAALSELKTAAVCAVIIVVPMAFELNDLRATNSEATSTQTRSEAAQQRLESAQGQFENARSE